MGDAAFRDRSEAGRQLGEVLSSLNLPEPVVLGLPRGGVVVAAAVAAALTAPLDVLVVRKLGHPAQPELGLGAVAEDGVAVFDEAGLRESRLTREDLEGVVAAERAECRRRTQAYRQGRRAPDVARRTVVLVDDGVATGMTALAGLGLLRRWGAARLVMAAPVASDAAARRLLEVADELAVLVVPRRFGAVSRFYVRFDQTSDAEVNALLAGR